MSSDAEYTLQVLKSLDPERYLTVLYLNENIRSDVIALWAFDAEISRIPDIVSEPMPGEIRLQWWRDLLTSGDNAGSGPLARELMRVISSHNLPRETFHTYLDARIFDLYHDPMPDTGTFEGYLGETVSVIFQNAALVAGAQQSKALADASGHAGMAFGMMRLIGFVSKHFAEGRIYFPAEMLTKHGFDRNEWLSSTSINKRLMVIEELILASEKHLESARVALADLPKEKRAVFLQLAFVPKVLKTIRKAGDKLFETPIALSALQRQWIIFRAAMRDIP